MSREEWLQGTQEATAMVQVRGDWDLHQGKAESE